MNEVNTIPGSLARYLWIDPKLPFDSAAARPARRGDRRGRRRPSRSPAPTDRSLRSPGPSAASSDERWTQAHGELSREAAGAGRGGRTSRRSPTGPCSFRRTSCSLARGRGLCRHRRSSGASAPAVTATSCSGAASWRCSYFALRERPRVAVHHVRGDDRSGLSTGRESFRRTGSEIPIGRVQDVTYHQSIIERLVRAGSLTVESAGRHGQDPFPDIPRPAEVQSLINRVVAQSGPVYSLEQSPPPPRPETQPAHEFVSQPITDPTPRAVLPVPPDQGRQEASSPGAYPSTPPSSPISYPPSTYAPSPSPPSDSPAPGPSYSAEAHPFPPPYSPGPPPTASNQPAPAPLAPVGPSIAQQMEELARLHRHGVITDAEYEMKRRELLERL